MIVASPSSDSGKAAAFQTALLEIGEPSSEESASKSEVRCEGTDQHDICSSRKNEGSTSIGQAIDDGQRPLQLELRKERKEDSQRSSISDRQLDSSTSPSVHTHQVPDSTVPSGSSRAKPALKSSLKTWPKANRSKNNGPSRRRVRGLWGETPSNEFSKLREATLNKILSYLTMDDICNLAATSRRWWTLTNHTSCWKSVDATDFVIRTYTDAIKQKGDAANRTGAALKHRLRNRTPDKLTIRTIRNRLNPNTYLPSTTSLKELTLTEFSDLTDTHVHVMLLSSAVVASQVRMKSTIAIRKLCLENCPLLTNGTLRSIASQCALLEDLSLKGCIRVDDINELRTLFQTTHKNEEANSLSQRSNTANSALDLFGGGSSLRNDRASRGPVHLTSLFGPPTDEMRDGLPKDDSQSNLTTLFSPPPTTALNFPELKSQSSQGLASLFAPPSSTTQENNTSEPSSSSLSSLFLAPSQSSTSTAKQDTTQPASSFGGTSFTSLSTLFAGQPKPDETNSSANEMPTGGLSSFFAPTSSVSVNAKHTTSSTEGNLTSLNLTGTSVTAGAFHEVVQKVEGQVVFESLVMNGSGESWQEFFFESLSLESCRVLDVGCADSRTGTTSMASFGIQKPNSLTEVEYLDLSGHKGLRASALANFLLSARKLCWLKMEGCTGVFSDKLEHFTTLLSAFKSSPCLKYINISRCFNDEHQAETAGKMLKDEEDRGKLLLDAICTGVSRNTIRELDMSWCWFATASEVAKIRRLCPKLRRIHLIGTRCNDIL